jgi:hypothetical protein
MTRVIHGYRVVHYFATGWRCECGDFATNRPCLHTVIAMMCRVADWALIARPAFVRASSVRGKSVPSPGIPRCW